MNEEKKKILSRIVSERIKIKIQLKFYGYLTENAKFH
jgi:hypothetical protein